MLNVRFVDAWAHARVQDFNECRPVSQCEEGTVEEIFENPQHPYTKALLSALPENATGDRLPTVSDFVFDETPQTGARP